MTAISLIMSTAREESETFHGQWQELAEDLRCERPSKYRPLSLVKEPFRSLLLECVSGDQESFIEPTLESLIRQTFKDFEIIIVDWHVKKRKLSREYNLNLKHVRGKPSPWHDIEPPSGYDAKESPPFPAVNNARDTGTIMARGDLLVYLDDTIILEPKTLETAWKWHKKGYGLKLIRNRFDIEDKKVKLYREFKSVEYNQLWRTGQSEYSYRGAWSHGFCVPLDSILEVNGWEEVLLDGSVGAEDIDMGARLHNLLEKGGNRMVLDVDATIWELGHKHIHEGRPPIKLNVELLNSVRDWNSDIKANQRRPTEGELEEYKKKMLERGEELHPYWRKFPIEPFSLRELRDKYKSGEFKW